MEAVLDRFDVYKLKRLLISTESMVDECDMDIETLRSLVLSLSSDYNLSVKLLKKFNLLEAFDVDCEMIGVLLESADCEITHELLTELLEIAGLEHIAMVSLHNRHHFSIKQDSAVLFDINHTDASEAVSIFVNGQIELLTSSFECCPKFGFHCWDTLHNNYGSFQCCSIVHDFATNLDSLYNELTWGWKGVTFQHSGWTACLENALLEILVTINEELRITIQSWGRSMGSSEMEKFLEYLGTDLHEALSKQQPYAIGRLHQTLLQLVEPSSLDNMPLPMSISTSRMMNLSDDFIRACGAFVHEKIRNSNVTSIRRRLQKCLQVLPEYLAQLPCDQQTQRARLGQVLLCHQTHSKQQQDHAMSMNDMVAAGHDVVTSVGDMHSADVVSIQADEMLQDWELTMISWLKPTMMEVMYTGNTAANHIDQTCYGASKNHYATYSPEYYKALPQYNLKTARKAMSYLPIIPLNDISNTVKLDMYADYFSEVLAFDVINISSMMGCSIQSLAPAQAAQIIMQLLNSGFNYVMGNEGKLLATLHWQRAALPLINLRHYVARRSSCSMDSPRDQCAISTVPAQDGLILPKQLVKKIKDFARVFRNPAVASQQLSLRLNSNVTLAIEKLRAHHGDDCWVDEHLQRVWESMACAVPLPTLLVFELWCNDEMIAADFGHPTANYNALYVATRFHERSKAETRFLQPGFMLALCECKYLQKIGFLLWDLGGTDDCPLMKYKLDLTGEPYSRPQALALHRTVRGHARHPEQHVACGAVSDRRVSELQGLLEAGVLIAKLTASDVLL